MGDNNTDITLTDGAWRAVVALRGAELRKLYNTQTSENYLWSGEGAWNRVSPILFPFIDQLPQNIYQYGGNSYINSDHPSHGFARDLLFETCGIPSATEVKLVLKATEITKQWFPFAFNLYVTYRLEARQANELEKTKVSVEWEVENTEENKIMYFSIGGHPGFQIKDNTSLTDYELVFENELAVESRKENERFLSTDKKIVAKCPNTFTMPITEELLLHGCIVLEDMHIRNITLQGQQNVDAAKDYRVRLDCAGFPVVALWTCKLNEADNEWAKFFCLEPWYGISALEDSKNAVQDIKAKPQIVQLDPLKSFNATYSVTIM